MKKLLILLSLVPTIITGQIYQQSDTVYYNNLSDIGIFRGGVVYQQDYNVHADTLFKRMTDLTAFDKYVIDEFFDTIGTIYAKLDRFWMFGVKSSSNAVVNWTAVDEDVTVAGTMTFTEYGGFTSDGSTAYINSNFNPSTDAIRFKWDTASFGVYSTAEVADGSKALMGLVKTDAAPLSYSQIFPRLSNLYYERCNNAGAAQPSVASTSTVGFFTAQRLGATTYAGINTIQTTNTTAGQSILPNNNYFIGATCNAPNSAVLNRGAFKMFCAYIGGYLTQAELSRLYRAIVRYRNHYTEGYAFSYGSITPYIAWVADDGTERDYTLLYKLAKWRNIKMTSAVITSYIGQAGNLNSTQIQEMATYGWEFASHSHTHPYLTEIDNASLHTELYKSDSTLTSITSTACKTLVYPYYETNLHVADSARHWFQYGLAGNYGAQFDQINSAPILDMKIIRSTLNTTDAYLQTMKNLILKCKNEGGVLIFATHASAWTTNDTTNIGTLIDYATGLSIEQGTVSAIMNKSDVVNKIVTWE